MIIEGILNPQINSLLSRVRHTNSLVIADRGFPSWPALEMVDISLIDDVPTVLQVLSAVRAQWYCEQIFMACEFKEHNEDHTCRAFFESLNGLSVCYEPHADFKRRVPSAVGIIRTGDRTPYANMILVSA